ncbi:Os09g0400600 [Oryza sativa Japonica Group]|uniref:Os09g0400600 protein n=1 Tax=Oryza sativa subsp. japonica TaxID=39947 RepID=A0A0P0XLC3_ORYSJ|nr:hypothetical protein EE612_047641 [Oryza sativa]KAF2916084.1 hypothetical protein DAI22_09g092300 [Oryza sativa Japonica Group]BAT07967.1 Os09g0400600 [Oryza sativa Japonica Group]
MIPKNRGWRIREGARGRTTPVTAVLQLLPTPGGVRQVCTLTSTVSASSSSRSPPAGATCLSHARAGRLAFCSPRRGGQATRSRWILLPPGRLPCQQLQVEKRLVKLKQSHIF